MDLAENIAHFRLFGYNDFAKIYTMAWCHHHEDRHRIYLAGTLTSNINFVCCTKLGNFKLAQQG